MNNLTNANKARSKKALDKLYRFSDHGVKSFRQLIDKGIFVRAERAQVPSVKWNRVKYNRMNWPEQQEYEKKLDKTKSQYRLWYDEDVFTDVPKYVFEYYNEIKQDNTEEGSPTASEEQIKHLFKL